MTILGLAGSLRAGSLNAQLLRLAAEELPEGVELEIYDEARRHPRVRRRSPGLVPDSVAALKDAIAEADAILVVTPEYNGSIPGF
jgi:NAD(P)H-dependent FMN reductase